MSVARRGQISRHDCLADPPHNPTCVSLRPDRQTDGYIHKRGWAMANGQPWVALPFGRRGPVVSAGTRDEAVEGRHGDRKPAWAVYRAAIRTIR
jgi:hypothetical protein